MSDQAPETPQVPESLAAPDAKPAETTQAPTGQVNAEAASMFISSMADLKKLSPETWKKTMESIAQTILRQMRAHQERYKKIMRNQQ